MSGYERKYGVVYTSKDGDPWRLGRLARVCKGISFFSADTVRKIDRLHDQSGFLFVYWKTRPNFKDRYLCSIAWGSPLSHFEGCKVGESSEWVQHYCYVECLP